VPIPIDLQIKMELKVMKATMDEALKINMIPKSNDDKETWHEFLSRFHAQWTAQRWPNTDSTAMHLSTKLGPDKVLRWTTGHNLQEYVMSLNYSMAKGEPLLETTSLVTFALMQDRELVQNWTMFTTKQPPSQPKKFP
jgi:hypothetical protein